MHENVKVLFELYLAYLPINDDYMYYYFLITIYT